MFNLTGTEIVVILLLALVVLGPEKLPDAIRKFGRAYAELKKMSTGFQQEFRSALDEPMREMRQSADMLRRSADFSADVQGDVRGDVRGDVQGDVRGDVPSADDPSLAEPTSDLPFDPDRSADGSGDGDETDHR